jgi:hypothetical protein
MVQLKCRSTLAASFALLIAGGTARAQEAAAVPAPAVPAPAAAASAEPPPPPAAPAPVVPPPAPAAPVVVPTVPAPAPAVPAPTPAKDFIPGSAIAPGPGMSPQAPPVPPAPGGRAPSFGAPTDKGAAQFKIGGRLFGYEAIGIGSKPSNPPAGYSGTALHAPMLSNGKIPFWGGSGATLNLEYGTPSLKAYATYYFRLPQKEYEGYVSPQQGPAFGVAYLMFTPDPIGKLRLQVKAGQLIEVYGGPGQWGWGIFGPMLALRGYGETLNGDWDLTRDVRVSFTHGLLVNPGVPENYVRGDYNAWIEPGTSTWIHHAHLGLAYKEYTFKLHYAADYGTDERTYLSDFLGIPPYALSPPPSAGNPTPPHLQDGRMETYLAEMHWQKAPWGQIGVTGGLYNFVHAAPVSNGVWWAVDWTQGSREMIGKYLGPASHGNGKLAVLGAEWNFSVSSILWHPRSFTGRAPDIRVAIAGMLTRTLASDDPLYKNQMGYFFGLDTEYRMTSTFSLTFQTYGESRSGNQYVPVAPMVDNQPVYGPLRERWACYSINPGIAYHVDWTSLDRIQLIYGRRFYSAAVDNNSAQPLDKHMIALGGYVTF